MKIGDTVYWDTEAIPNGTGIAFAPSQTIGGTIVSIGRKYVTVTFFVFFGPNEFPMTEKILISKIKQNEK